MLRDELPKHTSQLAEVAYQAGVINDINFAVFQIHGYKELNGGLDAEAYSIFRIVASFERKQHPISP